MSDTVNTSEGIHIPQGILYLHTDPSYITPRGKVSTEDTEIDLRHISRAEDISKKWSSWATKTWHWEKMHKRCLPCSCSGSGWRQAGGCGLQIILCQNVLNGISLKLGFLVTLLFSPRSHIA